MLHGILANDAVRSVLLSRLRARGGPAAPASSPIPRSRDMGYHRLARALVEGLDWERLCAIGGITVRPPSFEGL